MLSSKSYETVEEELKESEAKKLEDEAQAKAEEVSESIKEETVNAKAPVSRKVYSAFAKSESISEEKSGRKTFSWFKGQIAQHKFYIIICNVNEVLEKGINGETQNGKI